MLNRRQFSTYLGLTVLGLLAGWLRPERKQIYYSFNIGATRMDPDGMVQIINVSKITPERYMKGLRVSHVHP